MAEQATSFVDEAGERITAARERVDSEISRIQKDLATRRKKIEKEFTRSRKSFEKQTRKQVKQLEQELQKSEVVKTLQGWRSQAESLIEDTFDSVLGSFQIASKGDVQKIDRKLTKLTKRLKDMERVRQTNGATAPKASTASPQA
jgi:polyhydroxyalkanoate synthesis regulator phasin